MSLYGVCESKFHGDSEREIGGIEMQQCGVDKGNADEEYEREIQKHSWEVQLGVIDEFIEQEGVDKWEIVEVSPAKSIEYTPKGSS